MLFLYLLAIIYVPSLCLADTNTSNTSNTTSANCSVIPIIAKLDSYIKNYDSENTELKTLFTTLKTSNPTTSNATVLGFCSEALSNNTLTCCTEKITGHLKNIVKKYFDK